MDTDPDRKVTAAAIREYLNKKGYDRDRFAEKVRLSRSTIDKMLVGLFSDKALKQVEKNTGVRFGGHVDVVERADPELGAYSRQDYGYYVGRYLFARPASADASRVQIYPFEIVWDPARPGLLFRQQTSPDVTGAQFGYVAIPRASAQVFISANDEGWAKLMVLSQVDHSRKMFGVLLTVGNTMGNIYMPIVAPVVLRKAQEKDVCEVSSLAQGDTGYDEWAADLGSVTRDQYARVLFQDG